MDRRLIPSQAWRALDRATLDQEYNARATVADLGGILTQYRARTEAAKATLRWEALRYGGSERERLDVYPAGPGAPVFVFIHGGYWRLLDAADSGFMAPAFVGAGACVVALDYDLCPAVTLDTIVAQCRAGLAWVRANIARFGGDAARIHVAGSSAGGQLAAMLIADGATEVAGATLLSGLFDLEPVAACHPNDWLRLDTAAARRNSPLHLPPPRPGLPVIVAVADTETAEFKRQSAEYAAFSGAAVVPSPAAANHFDIVFALCDPATPLARATLRMMGLAQ